MLIRSEYIFEFDENKDALNREKHGISFNAASYVFDDPNRLERDDDSVENPGEDRFQTLGKVGKIIFVVYAERGEAIRIISARYANKAERSTYNGYDPRNEKGWRKAT